MPFKKGQSGNPGGRPKELKGIKELAQNNAELAIMALIRVAQHGKSESARVMAANSILDRGFGKPVQSTEVSGVDGKPIVTAIEVSFVLPTRNYDDEDETK